MRESSEEAVWKEGALKLGVTAESTKGTSKMGRKTARAHLNGPMLVNTSEAGGMTSSMAMVFM